MFTKRFFTFRSISAFPSKVQQFQKLSSVSKTWSDACFHTSLITNIDNHLVDNITSVGGSGHCLSKTSNRNISKREMSTNKSCIICYEDLLKAQKDDSILIIDIREAHEIRETGKLPGSIHIPMGDVTNVLTNLSNEEFKKKYNKTKPCKDTQIILSCSSGRRSVTMQYKLQKLGFRNAYRYAGGWLEWESKQ